MAKKSKKSQRISRSSAKRRSRSIKSRSRKRRGGSSQKCVPYDIDPGNPGNSWKKSITDEYRVKFNKFLEKYNQLQICYNTVSNSFKIKDKTIPFYDIFTKQLELVYTVTNFHNTLLCFIDRYHENKEETEIDLTALFQKTAAKFKKEVYGIYNYKVQQMAFNFSDLMYNVAEYYYKQK